jgi:16S rRNA (uracil1498-N3)-methyltransferase
VPLEETLMRISRLYTQKQLATDHSVVLTGDSAHYLGKVLRAKVGYNVTLFNGIDGEFLGEIVQVNRHDVHVHLSESVARQTDTALPVHIGLGLSRGERMDYAIQKATELGVHAITPLFTEHSEVRLNSERADKRSNHWQKVAISASEQCGRCTVPEIHHPATLTDWVQQVPVGQGYLLDHTGEAGFRGLAPQQVFLLIGPEGGISATEKALALAAGFSCVRLGPRILRTETAPVVALTALQLQWGDF